ncbi:cation diffusion facilitator family transporter [Streptomyces sp. MST-110588]|uniref:cation diffusion facilitator family transporter n=1 Tax=Streptomyces sp. MST-110588 TaxID=2833628 RepID=UPI001F5C2A2B|nr:cation diffusion facilitator family transporter [Streptomyces sp. MST-110588]UNO41089.1 cation transporter [Streptomyces sp. MST-110588]
MPEHAHDGPRHDDHGSRGDHAHSGPGARTTGRGDHSPGGHGGHAHGGHAHGSHGHSHGPGGHSHGISADADRRWLRAALVLITAYMAVEVVIGFLSGSLALISDAAHMLTDAASIVLALVAMRLAARPARGGYTYGLKRAEILSAQANGITLLVLSLWLAYEAVARLLSPPEINGGPVLVTALTGVLVNLVAAWCLSRANRSSLNVEGAYQHILTDLFGFIATAVSGAIVLTTGFVQADAIATLVVVALMLRAGLGLVRDSGRIFMEAAPAGLDPDALGDRLVASDAVVEVHDLHIWEITSGEPALSAHVLVAPAGDCHAVRRDLQRLLSDRYGITHATLQVDHLNERPADGELLHIAAGPAPTEAAPTHTYCEAPHGPVHRAAPHRH